MSINPDISILDVALRSSIWSSARH